MAQSRIPSHIALYDSSYVILFDNGSWSSEGVPRSLFKKMHQATSNIEFVSLGPYKQCFLRLDNGEIFYYVKDRDTRDELKNSNDKPYKLWFSDDDGYILQYADLSLSWNNIPRDFHNKLNRRKKTLTRVENITFGCDNTWWVSFDDGTACWSQNIPSYINKHLKHTKYFVLDPYDRNNYYIFKEDGSSMWQVNDDFDDDINEEEEEEDDDDVVYINPRRIRYTQTSISPRFSNGQTIEQLKQDLADGSTSIDDIPTIDVIKTRSGNLWTLNNRRLWCFRHASNIYQIPVRIVDQRPTWFNDRIQQLENPFEIHVRGSSEESDSYSDDDNYY